MIKMAAAMFLVAAAMFESVSSSYDTSMVNRLLADRKMLIQDGLSFFNGTTLKDVQNR